VAAWEALDPIERVRRHLRASGRWGDDHDTHARDLADALRTRLRDAVQDAPDPSPLELFDHVSSTPTPALLEQRRALAEELAAEG
jgi:pyruvate dehydrogenase E1 component alpha subunit